MKEKYLKKIYEANDLAMKCQKINLWGASATTALYVTAYNDFAEVLEDLRSVISCAKELDGWEKCKIKFKNDSDFDIESVVYAMEQCEKQMDETLEKLRVFVKKRDGQGWDINY